MNKREMRVVRNDVDRLLDAADRLTKALDDLVDAESDLAECRRSLKNIAAWAGTPGPGILLQIKGRALDALKLTDPLK